ncbi:MAG: site-2 protease family protein, partial [Candidatus Eremiobacteraeota bacterium]|nr:site-2 protease family protein [Candidatus Eremiobacteraeota bacterium]
VSVVQYLPPPERDEPSPANVTPRRSGVRGAIGTAGAAILAFLLKFKLALFLGLKLLAPSWTFLLSLWIYVVLFGWKLAVVLMFVLLAHELGHYFAFRAYGLPARLPQFVPLFGAFTAGAPPEDLEHDAYIALAGPLTGLGLAAACYAIAVQTNDRFWFACADVSAFLNLFNMIPMPPFDGGRIIGALWPPLWFAGFGLFVAFAFYFHVPLLFVAIIGLLGLPSMISAWRGNADPRAQRMTFASRLRVSGWYLATLLGLFFVMAQSHALGSPGAASGTVW